MKMLIFGFDDNQHLQEDTMYPLSSLSSLKITWRSKGTTLNTFIIYDEDAPYPSRNTSSPYLHLLVVNIPGNDISQGKVVAPYMPPNPPSNSDPHHYVVALYNQHHLIEPLSSYKRNGFAVQSFTSNMSPSSQMYLIVLPKTQQFYISSHRLSVTPNPEHPLIISNTT